MRETNILTRPQFADGLFSLNLPDKMKYNAILITIILMACLSCNCEHTNKGQEYFEYSEGDAKIRLTIPVHFYQSDFSERSTFSYFQTKEYLRQADAILFSSKNPLDYIAIFIIDHRPSIEAMRIDIDKQTNWMDSIWIPWMFGICKPTDQAVPLVEKIKVGKNDSCYHISKVSRFYQCDASTGRPTSISELWMMDSVESELVFYQMKQSFEYSVHYHTLDCLDSFDYQQKKRLIESVQIIDCDPPPKSTPSLHLF